MHELSVFCCHNSDCPDFGKRGQGNLTVRRALVRPGDIVRFLLSNGRRRSHSHRAGV